MHIYDVYNSECSGCWGDVTPPIIDTLTTFERYDEKNKTIWAYNLAIYNTDTLYNYYGADSLWQRVNGSEVLIDSIILKDTLVNFAGRFYANYVIDSLVNGIKKIEYSNIKNMISILNKVNFSNTNSEYYLLY